MGTYLTARDLKQDQQGDLFKRKSCVGCGQVSILMNFQAVVNEEIQFW